MKIAVLGLGFMGSTHLKAYAQIPNVELVAVASNVEKQLTGDLSDIQGNIGGPGGKMDFSAVRKYKDPMEAVKDPDVEAVDICLPTHQHAEAALAALRAGKHVLVEKPMALDGATADCIVEEAARSGRILMSAQVLRFIPSYRASADMLRAGTLGPVRSAIFRRRCAAPAWSQWLSDPSASGGGAFDLLIHDIDYCIQLFGYPEAVSATGHEDLSRGVDWILGQLHYPGIGAVAVSGGWHHPKAFPFSMEYTIVADGGTLEFNSAGVPLTLYAADGTARKFELPDVDGYEQEVRYFVECASQGKKPEFCPPEQSAVAVKVTRFMVESRSTNGEKIACRF
ncbi:MAG TPA: Gfo/Idh/MocA family oxidoreductase [Bryobacteraceae bacterium]|nr:Gfo/Idh/MocA family oxidoreductase [Bryobacteraceae bacterium]